MQVFFEPAFIKDFEFLEPQMKRRVRAICLDDIPSVRSIGDLLKINGKQMVGWKGYYRIRVGEHRIGFRIDEGTIVFLRVLHRKDMYRHFP
jgi:mRNA-degrading endonuclease RelE of RelBE toxin-antitoxin system